MHAFLPRASGEMTVCTDLAEIAAKIRSPTSGQCDVLSIDRLAIMCGAVNSR